MTDLEFALPFLTEADPGQTEEGSLDPLGLAPIADRLADQIAPDVTARMNRIRFLTAIVAGASIAEELGDAISVDGRTPAYLAYEWIVVEAMARCRKPQETEGVPGIQKARNATSRARSAHLDAGAYLQVPKVFGFHGVYKRLARALGLVDRNLLPLRDGDALLRTWEREQGLPGFAGRSRSLKGGQMSAQLLSAVEDALKHGHVTTSPGSHLWGRLAWALGPDDSGPNESRQLWQSLVTDREPIRRELILALRDIPEDERRSEAAALRKVAKSASPQLRTRLRAIDRYERFAWLLSAVLGAMQVRSTSQGTRPVMPADLATSELVSRAAKELPDAARRTAEAVVPVGQELDFELTFSRFMEPHSPAELVEGVLEHHESIQAAKGKRPWIERMEPGFCVRPNFRLTKERDDAGEYVHPYRVGAISSFITDLRA